MALIKVNFRSKVLLEETALNIILPEGCAEEDIPTVYLLHGMHGDHTLWCRKTNIERYAAGAWQWSCPTVKTAFIPT